MNHYAQAQSAYDLNRHSLRTDPAAEYDTFLRITSAIKRNMELGDSGFSGLVSALHQNRRLWTILATEVADKSNKLPAELRAQVFYLAEFTEVQTRKVLRKEGSAEILVEINTSIMRGLK